MKKSLILIAIITIISACILVFSFRAAHPFTFEGELDPNVFMQWPRISQGMITPVIGKVVVQNPNPSSPIKKVQLILFVPAEIVIAYQYFKNGEIYRYEFDNKADRYIRKKYTEEETKGCVECHQGELKTKI